MRPSDLVEVGSNIRTLPRRCEPVDGESFTSFMERLAWMNEVPLAVMVSRTGLVREELNPVVAAWGMAMSPTEIRDFATATRLGEAAVKQLLLSSYSGRLVDLDDVDPVAPSTVQRASIREWLIVNGSRFCPECLAEQPRAWQLKWKLPWSFACTEHAVLLRDTCGACALVAHQGRGDARAMPAYLAKVHEPGCCRNVPATGRASRGTASQPCGAQLWMQSSPAIDPQGRVSRAQMALNRLIEVEVFPGEEGEIARAVQDIRSIASLILLSGSSADFCCEDASMKSAVEAHLNDRWQRKEERSVQGRNGPRKRIHTWSGIPVALAAAAITPAVEIASMQRRDDLVGAMSVLARSLRAVDGRISRQLLSDFHLGSRMTDAFEEATAITGSFGRTSIHRANVVVSKQAGTAGRRHVPQLMSQIEYVAHFKTFLPNVSDLAGRRFCALAAAKSYGGTWSDAAYALDLPAAAAGYPKKAIPLINGHGNAEAFRDAVGAWVDRLEKQPVDYVSLRTKLRHFTDMPAAMWSEICSGAGIGPGAPGGRSRYAAAWLWAEITCGDWRLAPSMSAKASPERNEIFGRMVRGELAPALPVLLEMSDLVLQHFGSAA